MSSFILHTSSYPSSVFVIEQRKRFDEAAQVAH
jgi:hypothetical protein